MQRGKLEPENEEWLRKHYVEVKENIDALILIDILYSWNVISNEEKEMIRKVKLKSKRNEKLLQIILDSGPGDNFEKFISALKMNYTDLKIVQEKSKQFRTKKVCADSATNVHSAIVDMESKNKVKKYDITVLLVGESGSGKSSTCKTLMSFNKEDDSLKQPLGSNEIRALSFNGRNIQFVDSPSIELYNRDTRRLIQDVKDSIDRVSDGFHAFLLIIKYRRLMKNKDLEIVKALKSIYGPDILKSYCVLIVTHGDKLKADYASFKDWCLDQDEEFKNVYQECGLRAVVIDNTTEDKEIITGELDTLIDKIDHLQFNGRRYTADHFKQAELGRRQMLLKEKKTSISEETCLKCIAILQSAQHIKDECTEENAKMQKKCYDDILQLMGEIILIDEGTGILNCPLTIINGTQSVITRKLDFFLNAKEAEKKRMWKDMQRGEKKILNKVDKLMEKVKYAEEKLELEMNVMLLKQRTYTLDQHNVNVKDEYQHIEQPGVGQSQVVELKTNDFHEERDDELNISLRFPFIQNESKRMCIVYILNIVLIAALIIVNTCFISFLPLDWFLYIFEAGPLASGGQGALCLALRI